MRIGEDKVLQMVEKDGGNSLVLVDEKHGTEIEVTNKEFAAFSNAVSYFWTYM